MYVITFSSGSLSVRVRSSNRRLVQASRWLSEVRLMKYARASLHTLHQNTHTNTCYLICPKPSCTEDVNQRTYAFNLSVSFTQICSYHFISHKDYPSVIAKHFLVQILVMTVATKFNDFNYNVFNHNFIIITADMLIISHPHVI